MGRGVGRQVGLGAHATEVAPYFYTWEFFNNSYVANSLAPVKKAGVGAVTLAFGVSGGGCTLGGGLEEIMNDSGTKADVQSYIAPATAQARGPSR
jgi:hypothetical protein